MTGECSPEKNILKNRKLIKHQIWIFFTINFCHTSTYEFMQKFFVENAIGFHFDVARPPPPPFSHKFYRFCSHSYPLVPFNPNGDSYCYSHFCCFVHSFLLLKYPISTQIRSYHSPHTLCNYDPEIHNVVRLYIYSIYYTYIHVMGAHSHGGGVLVRGLNFLLYQITTSPPPTSFLSKVISTCTFTITQNV